MAKAGVILGWVGVAFGVVVIVGFIVALMSGVRVDVPSDGIDALGGSADGLLRELRQPDVGPGSRCPNCGQPAGAVAGPAVGYGPTRPALRRLRKRFLALLIDVVIVTVVGFSFRTRPGRDRPRLPLQLAVDRVQRRTDRRQDGARHPRRTSGRQHRRPRHRRRSRRAWRSCPDRARYRVPLGGVGPGAAHVARHGREYARVLRRSLIQEGRGQSGSWSGHVGGDRFAPVSSPRRARAAGTTPRGRPRRRRARRTPLRRDARARRRRRASRRRPPSERRSRTTRRSGGACGWTRTRCPRPSRPQRW